MSMEIEIIMSDYITSTKIKRKLRMKLAVLHIEVIQCIFSGRSQRVKIHIQCMTERFTGYNLITDRRSYLQMIHRYFVDKVSIHILYPCYHRQEIERKRHYRYPVIRNINLHLTFRHKQIPVLLVQRNVFYILASHVINENSLGLPGKKINTSILFVYLYIIYILIFTGTLSDASYTAYIRPVTTEEFTRYIVGLVYHNVVIGHIHRPLTYPSLIPSIQFHGFEIFHPVTQRKVNGVLQQIELANGHFLAIHFHLMCHNRQITQQVLVTSRTGNQCYRHDCHTYI